MKQLTPAKQQLVKAPSPAGKVNGGKSHPAIRRAPTGAPAITEQQVRDIIYPNPEPKCYWEGAEGPITCALAKQLIGWESEPEYTARMIQEDPSIKPEAAMFGDDFFMRDLNGHKVRCWNNAHNRPFGEETAKEYAQSILKRDWAGPTTMPGETVNGETIIIGRTGQVTSGQHRLIGLILACMMWAGKDKLKWEVYWPTEPVMESLLFFGASEDPRVTRSLDNVRPRTTADVIYTSNIFKGLKSTEHKECARMLAKALDFLWVRTGVNEEGKATVYQTHSESLNFHERHPRLLDCVKHIFEENADRSLSNVKAHEESKGISLSPGTCAGMLYLMGCSSSDGDLYRNMEVRSEKKLAWDNWERACEFWVELSGGQGEGKVIRAALNTLIDEDGKEGRQVEKVTLLTKAWLMFNANDPIEFEDPPLKYVIRNGTVHLDEWPSLGGIDIGPTKKVEPKAPTKEEIEAAKLDKRRAAADDLKSKLAGVTKNPATVELATKLQEMGRKVVIPPVPQKPAGPTNVLPARNGPPQGPSATIAEPGQGKPPAPRLIPPVPKPFAPPVVKRK